MGDNDMIFKCLENLTEKSIKYLDPFSPPEDTRT